MIVAIGESGETVEGGWRGGIQSESCLHGAKEFLISFDG
jgi:hypothetical protein